MAITVTQRLIIVIRPELQAQADAVALVADPTTVGPTFNVPLRSALDLSPAPAVAAYWCNWAMDDEQRARLLGEFGRRFLRSIEPLNILQAPRLVEDFWVFEGGEGQWRHSAVLTVLGLALMPVVE